MQCKAIFINKKEKEEDPVPETYGLISHKCPAKIKELIPFEDELLRLVKNIKFRKVRNVYQKKLFHDIYTVYSR